MLFSIYSNIEEAGFAEAPPRANYMEKKTENHKLLQSLLVIFIPRGEAFSAHFSSNDFYSPQKGREILGLFSFS